LNSQVKELISEVQNQKGQRDVANQTVRDLKDLRAEKTVSLKEIRTEFREKLAARSEAEIERQKADRKRSPNRIKTEMDRLERLYEQGRFLGKKEREYNLKMKKL
jgi:uncharacterized coiled-coil DUF342 family protein